MKISFSDVEIESHIMLLWKQWLIDNLLMKLYRKSNLKVYDLF